jgi:hypothetical protein
MILKIIEILSNKELIGSIKRGYEESVEEKGKLIDKIIEAPEIVYPQRFRLIGTCRFRFLTVTIARL